ncbi:MAG TPA: hypothetical protein VFR23_05970 [Jiangellaceae bacterium]|nr:hypothetical protein [Jiangellaceae bacterium]
MSKPAVRAGHEAGLQGSGDVRVLVVVDGEVRPFRLEQRLVNLRGIRVAEATVEDEDLNLALGVQTERVVRLRGRIVGGTGVGRASGVGVIVAPAARARREERAAGSSGRPLRATRCRKVRRDAVLRSMLVDIWFPSSFTGA